MDIRPTREDRRPSAPGRRRPLSRVLTTTAPVAVLVLLGAACGGPAGATSATRIGAATGDPAVRPVATAAATTTATTATTAPAVTAATTATTTPVTGATATVPAPPTPGATAGRPTRVPPRAAPGDLAERPVSATTATPVPHWTPVPTGFRPTSFSAGAAGHWYLAGTAGGRVALAASDDDGRHWRGVDLPERLAGAGVDAGSPAVAFSTARAGALSVGGYLAVTADGGRSWQLAVGGDAAPAAIAATPDALLTVLAVPDGFVVARGTAGDTDLPTVIPATRLGDTTPSIATSGRTVVVLAGSRVLRSTDDGRTFSASAGPCTEDLGGVVTASGRAALAWCATGTMGRAFVSTDGARSFHPADGAGANSAAAAPTGAGGDFAYAADRGLTLVRGGRARAVAGSMGPVSQVGFASPRTGYAVTGGAHAGLFRTVDGGPSWTRITVS